MVINLYYEAIIKIPFGTLKFLYVGSSDMGRDLDYYVNILGSEKGWDFSEFGTRVAAVQVTDGPLVLLAGHRPAPSCLPIFEIAEDLKAAVARLKKRGWLPERGPIEIPNGRCYLFKRTQ